ncbi:MAG: flagellar brake protein [Syntrophomonadaceae bacterium]|jgi:hypothetical protein
MMRPLSRGKRLRRALSQIGFWAGWGLMHPPIAQGITWDELSSSLHRTFHYRHPWDYENMIGLGLTLIIFGLLMAAFKIYTGLQQKGWQRFYNDYCHKRLLVGASTLPDGSPQKRQWFRLPTQAWLKWFHFRGFAPNHDHEYKQDRMVDIGGGGLSFTTEKKLDIGAVITFLLDVGSGEPLSVWGRVVRVQEKTPTEPQQYSIAIQFADLPNADRQRLLSWIMKGQRDAIQSAGQEESSIQPGHQA